MRIEIKALGDPATLLAAVLAVAGLAQAWDLGRRSPGIDFYQFWIVAQIIGRADVPSIYDEEAHARLGAEFVRRSFTDDDSERRRAAARAWPVLEPTATPLLYSAFRPLGGLDYESAHLGYRLASLAVFATGLIAVALRLGHSPATALLAVAVVAVTFRPFKAAVDVGNVNELQVGVIAAYLWLSSARDDARRQVVSGALLSALVLFKPNLVAVPALLAAMWAVRGRRRKLALQAAGAAAGVLVAMVVTAAVFGSLAAWRDWLEYVRVFPPEKMPLRFGNVGLAMLAYETMALRLTPWLATLSLGLALTCVRAGRPRSGEAVPEDSGVAFAEDTAALGAGCFVYLLSAPMVWDHYLLLALPAALLLLRDSGEDGRSDGRRVLTAAALVAIAVNPVGDMLQMHDIYKQAALTAAGLMVLFALTLRELARPRP